jgi:hypothetical protein
MDYKQSENNCSSSLMKIEKIVLQARNINVAEAISFEVIDRKYNLLKCALDNIGNFIECNGYIQLINLIQDTISSFGYEISYNKTFETQAQLLHKKIVFRLSEIAETSLDEVGLYAILKEKSMYIWDEPERSILLERIKDIEKQ